MNPEAIVALARSWIGTPYLHQASAQGLGCDCLGLILGIWRDFYGEIPENIPPYTPDWSEPQRREHLYAAALRHLHEKPAPNAAPGDVILFRMRDGGVAKHMGLQAETGNAPTFVHSYSGHGVVESAFSDPWARRVAARFTFP